MSRPHRQVLFPRWFGQADFSPFFDVRYLLRTHSVGMALPSLSECKACAVLIRRRDTARSLLCLPSGSFAPAFLHEYSLPLPLRFRCHCDLCLCLCADISIFFVLTLAAFLRGVLARLLPSTLRSGLRLRPGRSGIFFP